MKKYFERVKQIIDIKSNADSSATIDIINEDVYLRGSNIYYLICSALLSSVGLDVGSPAVIIGAMLISPLMSPILGIGLSLGVHDKENFVISLREFTFSVVLSLLVSVAYFAVTPLGEATTEILYRVKPTVLDIIVAFFGGIAGIIAVTRKKTTSAIPGVAIATALMPPICTAGFGLATYKFEYFFGAIYLFFINAVFISFSAYLIVRYLNFPFKEYPNKKKLFRTRLIIQIFVVIAAIPSIYIFIGVINDARLNKNLEKYIKEKIVAENYKVIEWKYVEKKNDKNELNLFVVGPKITEIKMDSLNSYLPEYNIDNTDINITQLSDEKGLDYMRGEIKTNVLETMRLSQKTKEEQREEILSEIQKSDSVQLKKVADDIKIFFPEVENIGFHNTYYQSVNEEDSAKVKVIPSYTINWRNNVSNNFINSRQNTIYSFLKSKTAGDTIQILNIK